MSQLTFLVLMNVLALAFNAGVLVTVVRMHGSDIKDLKYTKDRHDREIGALYGKHPSLVREVRA